MSRTNRALPLPIRAFTLIELLVVLVIILVLIGVLVPALSSSRNTARRVASQSQLKGISAAIESYATTFNSYPGYFSEQVVDAEPDFTSTENLVLSLMGGVDNTGGSGDFDITENGKQHEIFLAKIGQGPRMANGRKMDAFYAAKADELQVIKDDTGGPLGGKNMPELIDTTSGMPILYYRANRSGTVPVSDKATANPVGKFALDNNDLYLNNVLQTADRAVDQVYSSGGNTAGSLLSGGASDPENNLAWFVTNQKLSNIGSANTVEANETDDVVAGKYVLISPGVDGVYFSGDQLSTGTSSITGYDQLGGFDDVVHVGGQ